MVDGLAAQADLDGAEVQRGVVEVSLGIPLDADRAGLELLLPGGRVLVTAGFAERGVGEGPLEAVASDVDREDALLARLAPVAAAVVSEPIVAPK